MRLRPKIKEQKRHIAVDTLGLLLCVIVTAASVQDRDGAHPLPARLREKFSTIAPVWADGGRRASKLARIV
ncbi:transposase [Streptosporangium sp. NPDC000396]|uniref:transposase n=1 Tax=Streptosporangium sp. NPDC000396 TaxID=3366185 RepID=UPI0036A01F86